MPEHGRYLSASATKAYRSLIRQAISKSILHGGILPADSPIENLFLDLYDMIHGLKDRVEKLEWKASGHDE
jgi:hypothetical protein